MQEDVKCGSLKFCEHLADFRCSSSYFPYFYAIFASFAEKYVKIVNDSVVGFTIKDRKVFLNCLIQFCG